MSEQTLRMRASADVAALNAWTQAVRGARVEVEALNQATRQGGGGGGGAPPAVSGTGATPTTGGGGAGSEARMELERRRLELRERELQLSEQRLQQRRAGGGGPAVDTGGGGAGEPGQSPMGATGREFNQRAGNYLTGLGSAAVAIGLGSSIFGFMMSSGQKFMELSKIMEVVSSRFRSAEGSVLGFGTAMGYTRAESAGLVEALGNVRNNVDRSEFQRYTGFARTTGMDPNAALSSFGHMATMRGGGALTQGNLGVILGAARMSGMDEGRLPEFIKRVEGVMQQQFQTTGHADGSAVLTSMLPGYFMGFKDPRTTEMGEHFTQGLQQTMTGGTANRTFLMRAMGYGSQGGPSYIEMRKRMEAGIHDPRNLQDMFRAFNARGLSRGAMFRAIEAQSGGSLRVDEIEALINKMGTPEGLELYGQNIIGGGLAEHIQATGRAASPRSWAAEGRQHVSIGEARALQMENMQMVVGAPVATAMFDLTEVIKNLAKSMSNLAEQDLGKLLTDLTGGLKRLTEVVETGTRPGGAIKNVVTAPIRAMPDDFAADFANNMKNPYMKTANLPYWLMDVAYENGYIGSESGGGQ